MNARTVVWRETRRAIVGRVLDFLIEFGIAISHIDCRRPSCRADRDDQTGGDEERWPHLRPIGDIVIATDFHRNKLGEWRSRRAYNPHLDMIREKRLASEINDELRDICQRLDESAALVRKEAPEECRLYAIAVARVFDTINTQIFEPLYREHPEIAPSDWNVSPES